jgi:ATP-dependent protease Clp ATPase subunit
MKNTHLVGTVVKVMKVVRLGQPLNCTFCQKSESDVKRLIASPDRLAFICDECSLQAAKLKNIPLETMSNNSSASSGVFGFLRRARSSRMLKCSFCSKRTDWPDLYQSAAECGTQTLICRGCLDVCRQILKQEPKAGLYSDMENGNQA